MYLITELGNSIIAYNWNDERGRLTEIQTVTALPAGFQGESYCGEIEVHPNGKFLYASNRGHDSLVVFAVDDCTGKLDLVEHVATQGEKPRNFAFDPSGGWLIVTNHDSDNAAVFRVDQVSGRLIPYGAPIPVPYPFGIQFLVIHPV
jgi:6-phosphogluconolactonase